MDDPLSANDEIRIFTSLRLWLYPRVVPCVIHEDDHLLVVNKPAGWNTHAPSPFANEGIYDWLRSRGPRWATLGIMHRLDKDTSGVLVFTKSALANRSLTAQFAGRELRKRYLLVTDRKGPGSRLVVRTPLARLGERYASVEQKNSGGLAETRFEPATADEMTRVNMPSGTKGKLQLVAAEPVTGRTHQIRVHAAESGFPILGDTIYGGTAAERVWLHAWQITLQHPETGEKTTFEAAPEFSETALRLRAAVVDGAVTDCHRLIHGAGDGWPGWYVDRVGEYLLAQSETAPNAEVTRRLTALCERLELRGIYYKELNRQVRHTSLPQACPRLLAGKEAPDAFTVSENRLRFEMSFAEGYSVGLFLDQRDNRRRLLTRYIAPQFSLAEGYSLLNCFAYTCGFSVAAAAAGAITTSLDLSKKYLEWGRRNFGLNGLDPAGHDFIFGDVFDWLGRLGRKGRKFDAVILDPPTFSQSKVSGVFRAERDYGKLVQAALRVLKKDGVLFCSSNAAGWTADNFLKSIRQAASQAGRAPGREHYCPQPPDYPIARAEPGYLKTVWLSL